MVQPYLKFAAGADGKIDMVDGVTISKQNERCDNANFDQWFTDVPSVNKRVNTTLDLIKKEDSEDYVYGRSYNNIGFFPLDSINPKGTGYSAAWLAMVSRAEMGDKTGMQYLRRILNLSVAMICGSLWMECLPQTTTDAMKANLLPLTKTARVQQKIVVGLMVPSTTCISSRC